MMSSLLVDIIYKMGTKLVDGEGGGGRNELQALG